MENLISISLTDAQWAEAEAAMQTLKKLFDGQLVTLSVKQRKSFAKMGDGSLPFTEKAVDYARRNPEFLPPFVKVEEFEADFKAARMLNALYQSMSQLADQIDDSMLLAGSEAYAAARSYYASVKTAAKARTMGAKTVEADLAARFVRIAKPEDPAPEPTA
ncbi:hypothetical protein [Chryseolinea lacunae]|uniref:Uncharacterized protein n=1 Tax=Chryseolinea lacunae TaxID=2801331 RepID=A0ABS1KZY0_9BACT|nr:hypothetical protein [Chryseolinea lacunae]MBL0745016.1 hypothetical protein [Chryseolinea lacunae]